MKIKLATLTVVAGIAILWSFKLWEPESRWREKPWRVHLIVFLLFAVGFGMQTSSLYDARSELSQARMAITETRQRLAQSDATIEKTALQLVKVNATVKSVRDGLSRKEVELSEAREALLRSNQELENANQNSVALQKQIEARLSDRNNPNKTPSDVMRVAGKFANKADILNNQDYFTSQGSALFLWLYDKFGHETTQRTATISDAVITGDTAKLFISYSDGDQGYLEMRREDSWKIHDTHLTRSGGNQVDVSMSYWKEHEFMALMKNFPLQMTKILVDGFCKGLVLGKGLFK